MNELALFAGAGGGILGSKLIGHRMVGYVEINEYCQKIIRQRIDDGVLDNAPIFTDIRSFNDQGYADGYQGMVDIISGGFPCQDISCAGQGAGIQGERSGLWFEMEKTVRIVRPRYVFIENSPILIVRGIEYVIGGLAKMGFDCAWGIVSAADVGAPHLRKRIWILAHSACNGRRKVGTRKPSPSSEVANTGCGRFGGPQNGETEQPRGTEIERTGENVPHYDRKRFEKQRITEPNEPEFNGAELRCEDVADSPCKLFDRCGHTGASGRPEPSDCSFDGADANIIDDDHCGHGASKICRERRKASELSGCEVSNPIKRTNKQCVSQSSVWTVQGKNERNNGWWEFEPGLGRVANGVANRVDRLRAIGNGQVPLVAATAFRVLQSKLGY